jgi:hypothetical protein
MTYDGDAPAELCKQAEQSDRCRAAAAWLADTQLIDRDLFAGQQHALRLMGALPRPGTTIAHRVPQAAPLN